LRRATFSIPIHVCIRQDATLHSLFYLETVLHVSSGTSTHHQKRIQLYLQHLVFVTPLLLSAAISWNRSESAVGGARHQQDTQTSNQKRPFSFWARLLPTSAHPSRPLYAYRLWRFQLTLTVVCSVESRPSPVCEQVTLYSS